MRKLSFNLPKLDKGRSRKLKKLKKRGQGYWHQFKRYLPLILAFGLGLMIGLVQDRPQSGAPTSEAAVTEEVDLTEAEEFSDRIVEMLGGSQCSQIYSVTSVGFRANASEEDWLAQCTVAASVLTGEAASIERADTNQNDDVVEFSYRINADDEQTYIVLIQTVNRDGAWKLQGINSQVE